MPTFNNLLIEKDRFGEILSITMPRPSNFHAHLRQDALMRALAYQTMVWVKYLLVMPNNGPIDTIEKVIEYYDKLMRLAESLGLKPTLVMTIYLTEKLTPHVVEQLARLPFIVAVKYYPPHKGATTNSGHGIPLSMAGDTLKEMTRCKVRFLGHFEAVYDKDGNELPMALREGYFMQHEFRQLRDEHPDLQINIEHASTALAVARVQEDPSGKTTCGFTPHHLTTTIDELMLKSWRNHGRCMPIPKPKADVEVCLDFATSGDFRAHLGDDTAPHLSKGKEGPFDKAACGCWLPHALAMYARAFKKAGRLDDRFVQFACYNGPDSWGLPRPAIGDTVSLVRDFENDIPFPTRIPEEDDYVIPLGWTEESDRLQIGLRFDR